MGTYLLTTFALFVFCASVLFHCSAAVQDQLNVRTENGLVEGQRITYNSKELDVFYGIPYAKPPVGDLRFEKPQPPTSWTGTLKATRKPTACRQIDLVFAENITFSYQNSSEDCLYLNVIKPACSNGTTCEGRLPVMVFIHGGAFQWGDSNLVFYDGRNFVATSDVIFVSFNYRVGVFGFLSTETEELPGNLGLWDQNLALKWVKNNIGHFGGDPEEITLCGQSAGGISVGMHALSAHSKGLFKRIIMQSGTALSGILSQSYKSVGKLVTLAGSLGCYQNDKSWNEQVSNILHCLKSLDGGQIIDALKTQRYAAQIFVPVTGDDFLPDEPRKMDPLVVRSAQVFAGTNPNEAALILRTIRYILPGFLEAITWDYRTGVALAASTLAGLSLSESRKIVHSYFGDHDVKHSKKQVIDTIAEIIGDVVFQCPTHFYLLAASAQGIDSYRYMFAHRSSYSLWPKSVGVTHADELPYTLGSLPHIKERLQTLSPEEAYLAKLFGVSNFTYTADEDHFMGEIIGIWKSFMLNGKPTVPLSSQQWPKYSVRNPEMIYLRPQNYTKGTAPRRDRCKLWKKFLLKQNVEGGRSGSKSSTSRKTKKPTQLQKAYKPLYSTIASKASQYLSSSFLLMCFFLNATLLKLCIT
ncbi:acetylcholinesterase-like [Ornithodoros turicata]|uniref:acetylcholinesterase-like n=1 Tax=Ornithodoros turicata TaxID=34597 RepID=UPI003139C97D